MVNPSQTVFVAAVQLVALAIPALSAPMVDFALEARNGWSQPVKPKPVTGVTIKKTQDVSEDVLAARTLTGVVKSHPFERLAPKTPASQQQSLPNQWYQANKQVEAHDPIPQKNNQPTRSAQGKRDVHEEAVHVRDFMDLYESLLSRGMEDFEHLD